MWKQQTLISLLFGTQAAAFPYNNLNIRDVDPIIATALATYDIPAYVAPSLNRDITDWLAIGDSFSAGISADVPADELNWSCSRFKRSYPNQMNQDPRFPGYSTSRTFAFGACTGAKMQDIIEKQIELGTPDATADYTKIGNPQIGTLSLSGNDLGFGDDCTTVLQAAHHALDDDSKAFELKVVDTISKILIRARTVNPSFQLYVTGYIRFWNDGNAQCDTISWAPAYKAPGLLTTTLRKDMNYLVIRLNEVLQDAINAFESFGGVYFVGEFDQKFDGHRFCEVEEDLAYHVTPTDQHTWFIHYNSPYSNPSSATGLGSGTFFDQVDSILIPPKDGQSTEDQIKAVNGNLSAINSAYDSVDSMTAALTQLAQNDPSLQVLPITWIRIMHPKGSGYTEMSNAVIDKVLQFSATGVDEPPPDPGYAQGLHCNGNGVNQFIGRDDMNDKIGIFCADAATQKLHDKDSGSITRIYNSGTRYELHLGIDWPHDLDISGNMEGNCVGSMRRIMDECDAHNNPLNWKHGGQLGAGSVQYKIYPAIDQGYNPGTCSFHLQEDVSWEGVDGPGSERTWTFHIEKLTMRDDAGNTIGTLGFAPNGQDGDPQLAGDGNSLFFVSKLPDALVITPEAAGGNYIQFTIGSQSWMTSMVEGSARCKTGGWSSTYSPSNRNMDCFFLC